MTIKPRLAGVLAALAAAAALAVAYFAQYVLLLVPCELCLWERWPYRLVIFLGILAALAPRRAALVSLSLAMLTEFAGAGIAFLHIGVERHWWNSPAPECNGILSFGAALPATPARPCDAPIYLIPQLPVSMATMDCIFALVFALLLLAYVTRIARRFT